MTDVTHDATRDCVRATDFARLSDELIALYGDRVACNDNAIHSGGAAAAPATPPTSSAEADARQQSEKRAIAAARELLTALQGAPHS